MWVNRDAAVKQKVCFAYTSTSTNCTWHTYRPACTHTHTHTHTHTRPTCMVLFARFFHSPTCTRTPLARAHRCVRCRSRHTRAHNLANTPTHARAYTHGYCRPWFIAPSVQIAMSTTPTPPAKSKRSRSFCCVHPELVMVPLGWQGSNQMPGLDMHFSGYGCAW